MVVVSAMYKFTPLDNYRALKDPLLAFLEQWAIRGTLLLAAEGLNGTIAGSSDAVEALHAYLPGLLGVDAIDHKESYHDEMPFNRCKVKLKKEIVTMGVEGIDPRHVVGTYVKPEDWNALISSDDVTLIDTRNDYEYDIGTFKGAVNPHTQTFRELPDYVAKNLDPKKHKKVAMFCTGGIRCEKSTAYLKEQGFEQVYHLEGGILKYLEEVPKEESLWQGECFVFDERVAVNHELEKGSYDQCHACRYPITEEDKQSEDYVQGVSCPHCADKLSESQVLRFQEREKQCRLAKKREEPHIGGAVAKVINHRREVKKQQKTQQAS